MRVATYACLALPAVNSTKIMTPDDKGYYTTILGAFNVNNSSGIFYPLTDSVKALFETGGIVRRRLDSGLCKAEYGHPNVSGMPMDAALQRIARIDENNVCAHISTIWLDATKDHLGKDIVLVIGKVKPMGPKGEYVLASLRNPEENVAWSLRSLINNEMYRGRMARIVTDAVTYDYVSEPGIYTATKFYTANKTDLALESQQLNLNDTTSNLLFTDADLQRAINSVPQIGFEDNSSTLTMIKTTLGWHKVKVAGLSSLNI